MRHPLVGLLVALATGAARPGLAQQPAGTTGLVVPYSTFPSGGANSGPRVSSRYHRIAMLLMPIEIRGVQPGTDLVSLGLDIDTGWPAAAAVTGTLKVWLRNTPDAMYHLNDNWNRLIGQQPNPFQLVYDGPLTVPVAGPCDVRFAAPFTYAGSGMYVAYEWTTTAPLPPRAAPPGYLSSPGYRYNPWWHSSDSDVALPPVLADSGYSRPVLRLGYRTPARDAAVVQTQGMGEVPLQSCVLPYPLKALIRNQGSQPLLNLPVTVVPGAGMVPGSGRTVVIAALAPGAETWVYLPLPQPALANSLITTLVVCEPIGTPAERNEAAVIAAH